MQNIISGYLWAYRNYNSGIKSLKTLKKFYSDAELYINVDYDGDFENYEIEGKNIGAIITKNNFQVGYCGDGWQIKVGRDCWPKENTYEWIRGLYDACKKANSKYMLILEEDDFLLRELSILKREFSMAIHASMPSSAGNWRPNYLPPEFMSYSYKLGGVSSAPGYGAGGGCVFNREQFIKSWDKAKNYLWNDYDSLKKINKIIGWQDFVVQFVMMIGGYKIIENNLIAQPWEVPNWKNQNAYCGQPFEMVCGLKNHEEIIL